MLENSAIMRADKMAIYNRIKILIAEKELRERRKLPYRLMASEIGVSTSTITQYVTQKVTRFDVPTLEAFCRYFSCQPGELLWFVDMEQSEIEKLEAQHKTPIDNLPENWHADHAAE